VANAPARSALAYRVGAYTDFFNSMLARLTTIPMPPLAGDVAGSAGLVGTLVRGVNPPPGVPPEHPLAALTVRTTDDPAIALLDAWAVVLDVLTFYQERIANEGYLRTATEFRSVLELARLVGYTPRPPVGASVYLAYTLQKDSSLTIPRGSRATSTPGSGQMPQTFETSADLPAQDTWNALTPRKGRTQQFEPLQTTAGRRVWFTGLTTLLKPNDPLLLVFDAGRGEPFRVKSVTTDNAAQTTRVVLQDFSSVSVLGDATAAGNQAAQMFSRAVAALEDAEFDRLAGADPTQDPAHVTLETVGIAPVRAVFNDLLAGRSNTAIDTVSAALGTVLDDSAGLLHQLRDPSAPAPPEAISNAQNLLNQYRTIQDYLTVQSIALQVLAVAANGLPGADLLSLAPLATEQYTALSAAWSREAIPTMSAVTLANTLYETQQFVLLQVGSARQWLFNDVLVLCGQVLTRLVRTIFRPVLYRFFNEPQAGVDPDTVVAQTVITSLTLLITLTDQREFTAVDRQNMGTAGAALDTYTQALQVQTVADVVGKAQALRNQLGTSGEGVARSALQTAVAQFAAVNQAIPPALAVADDFTLVPSDIPDANRPEVLANIQKVSDAATAAGFTAALPVITALETLSNPTDPTQSPSASRFAALANAGLRLWRKVLKPNATSYGPAHQTVRDAITHTGLEAALTSGTGLAAALDAFLGTDPKNPATYQPDPQNVRPDRVGLVLADEIGVDASGRAKPLTALRQELATASLGTDPPTVVWGTVTPVQKIDQLVIQWVGTVRQIISDGAASPMSDADRATFVQRLRASLTPLTPAPGAPTLAPQALVTATAFVDMLAELLNDPHAAPDLELGAFLALGEALDPGAKTYIAPATQSVGPLVGFITTLVRLQDPSEYLAQVNSAIGVVRQQQRIADAGSYPRVTPWLDEFLSTLDQLMSDLEVRAYPAPTTTAPSSQDPLSALDNLLAYTGQPDPVAGRSPPAPASPGGSGAPREFQDLAPQIASGFNPKLAGPLYSALANVKVVRQQRFQGVHALRARGAPFGHNAQPRPITNSSGVLIGTTEWPLALFALQDEIAFQISPVNLRDQTFKNSAVELQVADRSGNKFPLLVPADQKGATHPLGPGQVTVAVSREERVTTDPASTARVTTTVTFPDKRTAKLVCEQPTAPSTVVRVQGYDLHQGDTRLLEELTDDTETVWNLAFQGRDNGTLGARLTTRVRRQPLPKNELRLDQVYDKVTPGSFIVVERPPAQVRPALENPLVARVEAVSAASVTDYGMPATRVTVLTLDRPWLTDDDKSLADIRDVTVYLQSEQLALDGEPYDADIGPLTPGDVNGAAIELDTVYNGLTAGRVLVVAGERTDVPATTGVRDAELVVLQQSNQVLDQQNTPGQGYSHTRLLLTSPLTHSYQRSTVTIYGNVVAATQGETRNEILGAGQASAANQSFALKQAPLTYLPAPIPSGAAPELEVRVNGVLWQRADDFNQLGPSDRSYVLDTSFSGSTTVRFGDGARGARLPTGTDNVRATYRSGAGSSGNLPVGQVNQLASRPLGVKDVINPLPAEGGADREGTDQARRNTPVGLASLGRLVSVDDYQDFARAFAGVAKARSVRLTDGTVQRVHLTISGPDGTDLPPTSNLYQNLSAALARYGDPSLPLTVASRGLQFLVIGAAVRVADGWEFGPVAGAVRAALGAEFGFDNREFAQPVYLSNVIDTIQGTPGVAATRVIYFGTVAEKQSDGQLTPLDTIVTLLQDITDPTESSTGSAGSDPAAGSAPAGDDATSDGTGALGKPPHPVLVVPDTTFDPTTRTVTPAEIAFLTPQVPDLLILVEWTP
jgi:predicted phage baseplate assembly protein